MVFRASFLSRITNTALLAFMLFCAGLALFGVVQLVSQLLTTTPINLKTSALVLILCTIGGLSFAVASYLVFYRRRLVIEVSDSAVFITEKIAKRRQFTYAEYYFTSYVARHGISRIPTVTSRLFRVISRVDNSFMDFRCFSFSRKECERLMACLIPLQPAYILEDD